MKAIHVAVCLALSALPMHAEAADNLERCVQLAETLLERQYGVSAADLRNVSSRAIRMSDTQIQQNTSSTSGSGGVFAVIGPAIIDASADGETSKQAMAERRRAYAADDKLDLTSADRLFIYRQRLDPAAVPVIQECVDGATSTVDVISYAVNDVGGDDFNVTFFYRPNSDGAPRTVKIRDVSVVGGASIERPQVIKPGLEMLNYTGYTQGFRRTSSDLSASVQLDIEGRGGAKVAIPAKKKPDPIPVGMIVASPLGWGQYAEQSGESANFDATKNRWAPCDGRLIAGSRLALAGAGNAPDLRGVFVRGLNDFGVGGADPVSPDKSDPDGLRVAGSFQVDQFKAHSHDMRYHAWGLANGKGAANLESSQPNRPTVRTTDEGGSETRPKNVALYYYVKIN